MSQSKFFFDVSGLVLHLRHSDSYSGIQRSVVNIIAETANLLGDDRVYLSYYDSSLRRYICVSMLNLDRAILLDSRQFKPLIAGKYGVGHQFAALSQYDGNPLKHRFHSARFALNALLSNEGFFKRRSTSIQQWKKYQAKMVAFASRNSKLETKDFAVIATKGDHLILLDSSWTVPRSIPHFEAASIAELKVHVLIHDLIPLVRPDLVPKDAPIKLYDWLISTSKFATSYLANSDATRRDFDKFLKLHNINKKLAVVPLAQAMIGNFVSSQGPSLIELRPSANVYAKMVELAEISNPLRGLAEIPFALCVGNLETRKNNWRIAQAWSLLREVVPAEKMPRLIFAGRSGWMNDDFDQYMVATGNLGGLIQIISGPSDDELAFLYRNCQFTVMASLYEGWGLPVGESLSAGKTAVVSNTSSLPEVGGNLVRYCDPLSPKSIMQACADLIMNPHEVADLETRIRESDLRTWKVVASDMMSAMERD